MLDIKSKYSLESACVQLDPGHGVRLLIVIEFSVDVRPRPPQLFARATLQRSNERAAS